MIGTLQDHGALENDPVLSAMTEVAKLYPHLEEPDFIVSLGTGELTEADHAQDGDELKQDWGNGGLLRLVRLAWEKSRDKKNRQIFHSNPRYLRLDAKLDGPEPRLDSLDSMDALESQVLEDESLAERSEEFAKRAVASLFYFELAQRTDCLDGKYEGQGYILCKLCPSHTAFEPLMNYLDRAGAGFYLNNDRITCRFKNRACFDSDGRFRLLVELRVAETFSITLKQGDGTVFHISASPLSVQRLETLQGLNAFFGRPNHKRRRPPGETHRPSKKVCR